jgi:cyclase
MLALLLILADVTTHYETVKVADGIYAFIAPESNSPIVNGNVTVITGDDGVVVVDTGQYPTLAQRQIAEIRKLTDKPVRAIVNTHWHWDHNLANSAYRDAFPSAPIVSTPFTRAFIATYTPGFLEQIAKMKAPPEFASAIAEVRKARAVAPDVTFDTSVTIHLGRRAVEISFPGRANTAGDAVVWVPDAKVLVTGDLVVFPTPFATSAYPFEWILAMNTLLELRPLAIVPGHGPVQRDVSYMKQLVRALQSVVDQTSAAVKAGLTLDEAKKKVDLDAIRNQFAGDDPARRRMFDDYFASSVVVNAYRQAKGETTSEAPFPK